MSREREAYMPPDLVEQVLEHAKADVVLIGGQALAFWMGYYGIASPGNIAPAVSRDVDFFTADAANTEPLERFAGALGGRVELSDRHALSALIGSATAPADEEGRVYNVDLVHRVVGIDRDSIEANAVDVQLTEGGATLRIMHPLDVLQSRNANLHTLAEKRDAMGQWQFRLSIEVARAYLIEQLDGIGVDQVSTAQERHRAVFDMIAIVSEYAREDAAKKNAERYGIFLADAIPAWRIEAEVFWKKQWPHLRGRMSADYAARCEALADRRGAD